MPRASISFEKLVAILCLSMDTGEYENPGMCSINFIARLFGIWLHGYNYP